MLPLPAEVVHYLRDAGTVVLPTTARAAAEAAALAADGWDTGDDVAAPVGGFARSTMPSPPSPSRGQAFPAFAASVKATIKELGGRAFPKLNWSAPRVRDAVPFAFSTG